jgi:hypothetical protein
MRGLATGTNAPALACRPLQSRLLGEADVVRVRGASCAHQAGLGRDEGEVGFVAVAAGGADQQRAVADAAGRQAGRRGCWAPRMVDCGTCRQGMAPVTTSGADAVALIAAHRGANRQPLLQRIDIVEAKK